jgi:hypothetical protein
MQVEVTQKTVETVVHNHQAASFGIGMGRDIVVCELMMEEAPKNLLDILVGPRIVNSKMN